MNRHIYTLHKPAAWHNELWREALPLGNGLTGALVTGAIAEESIQFNRHDLWHGNRDDSPIPDITETFRKMREYIDAGDYISANQDNIMQALQEKGYNAACEGSYPLGWLDMKSVPDGMFRHYRRGVNMRTAEAFVEYAVNGCLYRREMFISRDSDIAVIRMSADNPFTTTYDFRLFVETDESITTENSIRRTAKDGSMAVHVQFAGTFSSVVHEDKLSVTGQEYLIFVRCSSLGSTLDMEAVSGETYDTLLLKHTALHTPLYDAVSIELADDEVFASTNEQMLSEAYEDQVSPALLERLWRFGRYLFISAASEKGNPVPLYGLWHGGDNMQWCQYVANENVEMTYWHTMAGGLAYSIPALLRYYTSKIENFRECARQVFGMNGIWISAYTTPGVAGLCVPVAVISNWISCAGWLCRHFWEYYLYTDDETLLREEILPFMYEAAQFYRDYAVPDHGKIRLYPSVSPENTPLNLFNLPTKSASGHRCPVAQNATMDFAVMKELITNLLQGIEITGMYTDEADSFRDLLHGIPAYFINRDGAVQEWMHPELEDNYAHRHLSHIYPVFPGTEVTAHNAPVLFEAFRKAVNLRVLGSQCNWSLTHMASIYARFGEGEKAAECMDIMAKSVLLDSLLTISNDWRGMGVTLAWANPPVQLDAVFGTVNAVQEMLFCRQKEALSVLPALPVRMKSGAVYGMVFPEGIIDILWDMSGRVEVTITARRNLETNILLSGKVVGHICLAAGEKEVLELYR
ncbi:MAG: glycoside hydrolase N-terminal domain-containing protein [Clostridia bacterium]|nr:glycoside hydrolase N-terminal domain-containing protein [Clostridia bacterium]